MVDKYADWLSIFVGAIVAYLALLVTVLLTDGLTIDGATAWVLATVIVWLAGIVTTLVMLRIFRERLRKEPPRCDPPLRGGPGRRLGCSAMGGDSTSLASTRRRLHHLHGPAVGRVRAVSLWYHLRTSGPTRPSARSGDGWWTARIPAPAGRPARVPACRPRPRRHRVHGRRPRQPAACRGAFGDKSVVELPGYRARHWLDPTSAPWTGRRSSSPLTSPESRCAGELLTPPGSTPTDPLPLLVVHDGPGVQPPGPAGDHLLWLGPPTRAPLPGAAAATPDRDLSYAASASTPSPRGAAFRRCSAWCRPSALTWDGSEPRGACAALCRGD